MACRCFSEGALLLACLVVGVSGHGAVVVPRPRQAVDRSLKPWAGPLPSPLPNVESHTGWCPVVDPRTGNLSGTNGQACFWFSNGCAVGCPSCDGSSRGPIPGAKSGPASDPPTGIGRNKVGPNGVVCTPEQRTDQQPTMCDPRLRTVNTGAECGGDDDWYYYSPWRHPGAAPVLDTCGVAGGHRPPDGPFGGVYVNTSNARLGDPGSTTLAEMPTGTTWRAGSTVQVSWAIEANHGGGYQFRLAPLDGPLSEAEFQKTPLRFVGQQMLRWNGGPRHGGQQLEFNGTYVAHGVTPEGFGWAKNPIPLLGGQAGTPGPTGKPWFAPVCSDWSMCTGMVDGDTTVSSLEIVDHVQIPSGIKPGKWILGWRWDCEQSNQIWQSCSDVTIVAE